MTQLYGVQARFNALSSAFSRQPRAVKLPMNSEGILSPASHYFGENTLTLEELSKRLPKDIFQKLKHTVITGAPLSADVASHVAPAIRDWAILKGATHFCHWFQPQTGQTAEKHDAFLSFDASGKPLEKFSASQLIQSEPDASSFPSGGMRSTFEARGYTAWDAASPIFLVEGANGKTLCIPSVFISFHGDALDEKTGLLRSMAALSKEAIRLLGIAGLPNVKRVVATLGAEQEYFLVDRALAKLRPDLMMCGRTLVGGQPPRGQQLEDHYFGAIPARVLAFMAEVEIELHKLGVPAKTRHNEVAPNQFELAPVFEEANVSTDHNQITMEVLRKVAEKHDFSVLLHEKPFAGVNGSGKHNNWSLMITATGEELDGTNLLDPGRTPHQNLRFLLVLSAVLKGVSERAGLLRASIASSGNDHRLGANEAPPAIMSVFLGDMLGKIFRDLAKGTFAANSGSSEQAVIKLGVAQLPEVAKDNTDRNRTSPFAFTGNKFEFRAVGSSASIAFPVTVLNTAVADAMADISNQLEAKISSGAKVEDAILAIVTKVAGETQNICFEGNGYSDEWVREAERRGLPNLRKTPEALEQLLHESSVELFARHEVFSKAEITSRYHVRLERFIKNLLIEGDTLRAIIDTQIAPAAVAYLLELTQASSACKSVGVSSPFVDTLKKLSTSIEGLQGSRTKLENAFQKLEKTADEDAKARLLSGEVSQAMLELRGHSDQIECLVGDSYWPLPKYREMLFCS